MAVEGPVAALTRSRSTPVLRNWATKRPVTEARCMSVSESYLENFSARGGLAGVLEEGTAGHGRHGHAPQHHGNHGHQTHKENEVKQGGDKENEVKQRA